MEGLGSVLSGITISQLSIALHQLETKGYLHPDPHGTPNRKIRVTPLGRQVLGESPKEAEASPAPEASAPAPSPPTSSQQSPLPSRAETQAPAEEPLPSSPPVEEPARPARVEPPTNLPSDTSDEVRRRLRAVIEREEAVKSIEDRHRVKERELLNEEDRLAQLEKTVEARRKALEEQERQLSASEDQLHEHLTSLKGHLNSVGQVTENVHKLHEKVTSTRQKRQKSA
ncbi:MAG: hypothetical protein M1144_03115 [Candidatus Thermoplasmatota archaeon]|nr:hypothetical protein [Candidatus Thermoplasmatota archaeon]